MLSLFLYLTLANAQPTYSSSALNLDGSVSISNPREDGRYGYTYENEHTLCQRYGQEFAEAVQMRTALWGTYDSVHLDARGEVSEPTTAESIAKRLICYSVSYLRF